ncbi:MAG: class I SAM-dependent methyltransferase [Candidatus Syntrophonatronum acetioxidans]|uniref:Class I SAM-dependent methyltransferase n=1 Tax=Candidatus Syntrophonatronum acetioxidans TaxID=1795816 RepID=A0A424YCV3_9FIRM|nr:MAG: class I SAM-dependent methyltransferase [Candidatus Syntrophonatronum acetioxidans]
MLDIQIPDPEILQAPAFWEEAWFQAKEKSIFKKKNKTLKDTVDFWESRAENFTDNVMGEKGQKRVDSVIRWLEKQEVNLKGIKILDIGAGPGPFALTFAEKAKEVVALEPAGNMLDYLKEEVKKRGLSNVRVVQDTWEEVDLDQENLRGAFDLVFASMSPGINNWETIDKALQCSKKYCYISQFAGRRQSSAMEELWQEVFQEELPPWPAHVIYILNLFYAKGYNLDFRVWEEKREAKDTVEEALSYFLNELKLFGKEEPYPEEKVRIFLEKRAEKGVFYHQVKSRLGKILVTL